LSEEIVGSALWKAYEKLLSQKPPIVIYDKKRKTISVKYGFNNNAISAKIIAAREMWLELWNDLDFDQVHFNTIVPYLSRPSKKTIETLMSYAKEKPDDFSWDIFKCIEAANAHNPLYRPARKSRGGSPYGLNWSEMNKVKAAAAHLYVYLDHIRKQPEDQWPPFLGRLLKSHGISICTLEKDHSEAVRIIIAGHYNIDLFQDRFYKTFIQESPASLEQIRGLKRTTSEDNPFISPIFAKFKD
jgi:hypothetical protein